jgi:uncharacterized ParB-like nuclease family protein
MTEHHLDVMHVRHLGLTEIAVPPNRMRALQPEKVKRMAESMKQFGQLHPITVRPQEGDGYVLVAGRHRFEAAQQLKWEAINATVITGDDALLIEIDENLARADLSQDERRAHILKRKQLWEKRQAECGTPRPTSKANKGFAAETAAATGMTKRSINRHLAQPKIKPKSPALPTPRKTSGWSLEQPLNSLAWVEAKPDLRTKFLDAVGLRPLLEGLIKCFGLKAIWKALTEAEQDQLVGIVMEEQEEQERRAAAEGATGEGAQT